MPSTQWLSYAGIELVNTARAQAYSRIPIQCSCPDLAASLGDEPYTNPTADEAPWFDQGVPESALFWGVVGLEFVGAGNAGREHQWTELLGHGGVPGAGRYASKEIEVRALAFAATEQALSYGVSWLSAALQGSACHSWCGGDELCLYVDCPAPPEPPESTDCLNPTPPAAMPVGPFDPVAAGDALLRTAFNVACVEGPSIETRRRLAGGWVAEVRFVMKAGVPWWWRQPDRVITFGSSDKPPGSVGEVVIGYDPVAVVADCDDASADCMDDNPYEVLPPFPTEPVLELADPSYPVTPFNAARIVVTLPEQASAGWFTKVPIVRVHSGSLPMHRFTLRFYDNPQARQCGLDLDPCLACAEITLPWMPRDSWLVLDGRTRTATIECPGSPHTLSADHQVFGPRGGLLTWPEFDCPTSMCLEAVVDADATARDLTITIDLATREDTV